MTLRQCLLIPYKGARGRCPLTNAALGIVVLLQGLLKLGGDLLEKANLLTEEVLHLGLEVSHADLMEMVDLSQRGERDDVAALADALCARSLHLALVHVLLALLHFGQGSCVETDRTV